MNQAIVELPEGFRGAKTVGRHSLGPLDNGSEQHLRSP